MPYEPAIWRLAGCGLCATLVGIGLARFAYSPLIPALIAARWFTPDQAVYLSAANLFGYLAGVVLHHPITRGPRVATALRAMMLITAVSLLACSLQGLGFVWFAAWRLVSGYTGGVIMLLAAPTVLAHTPPASRGLVGGAVFMGVGLGVAASGILVPVLMEARGVRGAWIGLGGLSFLLTLLAWTGWPRETSGTRSAPPALVRTTPRTAAIPALIIEYGLNVVGLVPHMIFLADYVARGLGRGLAAGARYWVLYGVGATLGPLLAGWLADRVGFARALRLALLTQATAVFLPVVWSDSVGLIISSTVVGALTIGIVPLVLGRIHDLVQGADPRRRVWGCATTCFALAQALAGSGFSYLFIRRGSYGLLFGLGSAALVVALGLDSVMARWPWRPRRAMR
jgi:predicted MFS family arabinose efflux permease